MVNNSLVKQNQKQTFSAFLATDAMKKKINEMVGGEKGQQFVTSIISAVSANPQLAECDNASIVSAALVGQALNLSPSPQLGQFYMVPFNDNKRGCKVAQFQIGYKGYIQLAIRSGQYKKLNVLAIKEGELKRYDSLNEEIEVELIEDEEKRENAETIGYYAMFEYLNGFRKTLYWSKAKMEQHALKYSMGYRAKKGYTFWEKDFDGMAIKTMLRQLISKWGIMSIDLTMQKALESDMAVVKEDGTYDYIDNNDIDDMKENIPETFENENLGKKETKATNYTAQNENINTNDFQEDDDIMNNFFD
jgi:recombination protein RecT